MAKPQTRSETALQSAVMRFGDDAFRICYMHTKSGKETLTLLSDVFMQYFLDTQTFKSESEERLWVLRTAHKTCMDYYAQKIRKKLTDEQIAQRSKDMPFETPKELCDILRLHYTLLTAVALHYGAGDNTRFIGRVTGKSASAVQNQLEKAKKAANMSEDDLREWAKVPGVEVHYSLSKPTDQVDAHIGYINDLLPGLGLDWRNTSAIICASARRIKAVARDLMQLGMKPSDIYTALETNMHCGIGKCGHCKVGSHYMCVDGPVFTYEEMLQLPPEF